MEIKIAAVWDAPSISNLWVKLMEEVNIPGRVADEVEKERFFLDLVIKIKREDSSIVIAVEDGNIVGFASCYLHYYSHGTSNLIGTCDNIYIEKEYRGGSLMDDMLDMLMTFAKSYGVMEFEFLTIYDPSLIKVWTRKGYTPVQVTYMKEV